MVVADSTAVDDRSGNSLTTILDEAAIAELPDDPEEMAQVVDQMTGGAGAIFQVDGFRGGTLPPRDEIRQIRFRVNSFSADNHDAGRVQVQIITRPNLTAWIGNANVGLRSDALNARNAFSSEQTPELFRRFNTGIRGPIVHGRTALRLSVDGNRSFDSGTIVGQLEDGSALSAQFQRPIEAAPGGGGPPLGGFGGGGRGGGGFGRGGGATSNQRFSAEFYAQASNLFNRVNYGNVSGNLRSPFFGTPTSARAGRVEIGMQFRFRQRIESHTVRRRIRSRSQPLHRVDAPTLSVRPHAVM